MKLFMFIILMTVNAICEDYYPFPSEEKLQSVIMRIAKDKGLEYPFRKQSQSRIDIVSAANREAIVQENRAEKRFDKQAFVTEWEQKLPVLQNGEYLAFWGLDQLQYRGNIRRFDDTILVLGGFRIPARNIPEEIMARRSEEARDKFIQAHLQKAQQAQQFAHSRRVHEIRKEIEAKKYHEAGFYESGDGKWYDHEEMSKMLRTYALNQKYDQLIKEGMDMARRQRELGEKDKAVTILRQLLVEYPNAPDLSSVQNRIREYSVRTNHNKNEYATREEALRVVAKYNSAPPPQTSNFGRFSGIIGRTRWKVEYNPNTMIYSVIPE